MWASAKMFSTEKKYDEAFVEFRRAEGLDNNSYGAHYGAGRVLLLEKKDYPSALSELQQSEELAPSEPMVHDLYAQALEASGNIDGAISEFKETVALKPSDPIIEVKLARR